MAGIQLTPQRRSQLLELLLSQSAQRPQVQTALEAALRLGAQGIRQKGISDLKEQESAAEKRRGSQEAAALAELTGAPVRSVFGTELPDSGGQGAQLANLLKNNPNSPIAQAIAAAQIKQATTAPPPEDDLFTDINPKDFTPESVAKFEVSERFSDLRPRDKGPLTEVNVNSPTGLKPSDFKIFREGSVEMESDFAAMRAADRAIGNLDEGAFTGITQPGLDLAGRMLALVVDRDNPPEEVAGMLKALAASQEMDANTGILVGSIIRLFGSGTGLSDADREFARQISGALRNQDEESLRRILSNVKDAKRKSINRWNKQLKTFDPKNEMGLADSFGFDLTPVEDRVQSIIDEVANGG